jgi:hypothetical protein
VPIRAQQQLNIGIGSYPCHRLSIERMIAELQRLQIREIELSHGEFMLFSRPTTEKVAAARARCSTKAASGASRLLTHSPRYNRLSVRRRPPTHVSNRDQLFRADDQRYAD